MTTDTHLLLRYTQLKRWPANIRRTYHLEDVAAMAQSQAERAERGQPACIHELVVTTRPGHHYEKRDTSFFIVAGHLRHAGNVQLGKDAPLLNCVVRYYATEADLLADMRTENGQRRDPSPLEWAMHFQSELAAGVTERDLIKQSGKSKHQLTTYLRLMQLSPVAQQMIDCGDLPIGAIEHLIEVEDLKHQAKIAKRLKGSTLKAIQKSVTAYLTLKAQSRPTASHQPPATNNQPLTPNRPSTDGLPADVAITAADLRPAACRTCAHCDIGLSIKVAEPAWHIALAAAGKVCDGCDLKRIKNACAGCPLAEMMSRLARTHGLTNNQPPTINRQLQGQGAVI